MGHSCPFCSSSVGSGIETEASTTTANPVRAGDAKPQGPWGRLGYRTEGIRMRKSTKIATAIATAGIVAAGASAFTASSTIDNPTKHVGATGQTISGVSVTNVAYTWDSATDDTSGVSFHTAEVLGANDAMSVSLNGTAADSCTPTVSNASTDWACTWTTPVNNAPWLSIAVTRGAPGRDPPCPPRLQSRPPSQRDR